jgi:hypothetical protein
MGAATLIPVEEYLVTSAGMVEAKLGILETKDPAISVPLVELFE